MSFQKLPAKTTLQTLLPAFSLRLLLYYLSSSTKNTAIPNNYFINRPELSTPLTNFKYLSECIKLSESNIDPYQGDMCHELPIFVQFFKILGELAHRFGYYDISFQGSLYFWLLIFDCCSAFLIGKIGADWCSSYNFRCNSIERESLEEKVEEPPKEKIPDSDKPTSKNDKITSKFQRLPDLDLSEVFFAQLYLYNPISIAANLSLSTQILYNFLTLTFLYCFNKIKESSDLNQKALHFYFGGASFAILAVGQFWPVQLIFPVLFFALFGKNLPRANLICLATLSLILTILYAKSNYKNNENAISSIINFTLTAPDYSPNTGIWWYLIIEMFEHFRQLFVNILQINVFFYTVPICLFFKNSKFIAQDLNLIMFLLLGITSIFKSYTSLTDLLIPLTLIFSFNKNSKFRKMQFIASVALFICVSLCPIMWSQWVILGRGNANFFFAVTLGIVASATMLVTDVLYGHIILVFRYRYGISEDKKLAFGEIKFKEE